VTEKQPPQKPRRPNCAHLAATRIAHRPLIWKSQQRRFEICTLTDRGQRGGATGKRINLPTLTPLAETRLRDFNEAPWRQIHSALRSAKCWHVDGIMVERRHAVQDAFSLCDTRNVRRRSRSGGSRYRACCTDYDVEILTSQEEHARIVGDGRRMVLRTAEPVRGDTAFTPRPHDVRTLPGVDYDSRSPRKGALRFLPRRRRSLRLRTSFIARKEWKGRPRSFDFSNRSPA